MVGVYMITIWLFIITWEKSAELRPFKIITCICACICSISMVLFFITDMISINYYSSNLGIHIVCYFICVYFTYCNIPASLRATIDNQISSKIFNSKGIKTCSFDSLSKNKFWASLGAHIYLFLIFFPTKMKILY